MTTVDRAETSDRDVVGRKALGTAGSVAGGGEHTSVVVIGAGPAGLAAAEELQRHGVSCVVLEKDSVIGGLARTIEHMGCRFDVGPHRFFSKADLVEERWTEWLGEDMVTCDRLTRILYRGKYFDYPLKATNALFSLGPWQTVLCMASYAKARLRPVKQPRSFEDWVSNQFGKRLFSIFFKTYTEKVWGIPTDELSADWAAQRIKGLNLFEVARNAILPKRVRGGDAVIKTLIDSFRYPRNGTGSMWNHVADDLRRKGVPVEMNTEVVRIDHEGGRVRSVTGRTAGGAERTWTCEHVISTLPIRELVASFNPPLAENVRKAAASLNYRDFVTVDLVIRRENVIPDHWIYVHDPSVKVARISNFKNFSPNMVPEPGLTGLGLEYFCFEGDGIWERSDEELVELGKRELVQLGLVQSGEVVGGLIHRHLKAYPVYDDVYDKHLEVIRAAVAEHVGGLEFVGRNGMHRYNNQDHAMMTGILAAQNIATGSDWDVWKVNGDAEYHEEVRENDRSGRMVPERVV
ncbi:MAG TPA: NAD(P)/FAD-dependent oxidoreductase [Candidatus Dormibacteraeota bacterium]|nr:NAD(P)/FAD-dependent oxidoreductase [Candidatus Dormibacteraeota bacterium]